MVSADNLNLDVLEQIFLYLPHGPNLASVALVSRSFLEAVVPRLYSRISFRLRQAKTYPEVRTPFGAIKAQPNLATYVRDVEIFAIPQVQRSNRLTHHPAFIGECAEALKHCHNLISLKMTVPGAVTYFLPSIRDKTRLETLSLHANLMTQQSESLLSLPGIKTLEIHFGSWSVADVLPKWTQMSLHRSLRHLTLYMINDLNEDVLEATLTQLPELRGLHVIGCPKVDHNSVLLATRHTPLLEHLSMTTSEVNKISSLPLSELSCIRSLALDSRSADPQTILSAIFQYLRTLYFPLTSLKLRVAQKKIEVPQEFIKSVLDVHGHSLQVLSFLDCDVSLKAIELICKDCPKLERIDLALPMKDLGIFGRAISHAKNLRTIVGAENHTQHGPRISLTADNVECFMGAVPTLKMIIDGNRIWTRARSQGIGIAVSLERRPTQKAGSHWFTPREV